VRESHSRYLVNQVPAKASSAKPSHPRLGLPIRSLQSLTVCLNQEKKDSPQMSSEDPHKSPWPQVLGLTWVIETRTQPLRLFKRKVSIKLLDKTPGSEKSIQKVQLKGHQRAIRVVLMEERIEKSPSLNWSLLPSIPRSHLRDNLESWALLMIWGSKEKDQHTLSQLKSQETHTNQRLCRRLSWICWIG